jgi:hypothetical protein
VLAGAAFCPHPPVLVPDLAGAAAGDLDGVRAGCRTAIRRVTGAGARPVLVGAGPESRIHSPLARGSLAGFGLPIEVHLGSPGCGGTLELPLSLTVGAWLVADALGPRSGARAFSVGPDFAGSQAAAELLRVALDEPIALIVMGDGSACRTVKAPGYLDARAEQFDASVCEALAGGDAAALGAVDADLGAQLQAAGVAAWHAAARLLEGADYDAELLAFADPYGVAYPVAAWTAVAARG